LHCEYIKKKGGTTTADDPAVVPPFLAAFTVQWKMCLNLSREYPRAR